MYEELKARIVRCIEANQAAFSAHNAKIINAAAKELFEKTGEVYSNGQWIKAR